MDMDMDMDVDAEGAALAQGASDVETLMEEKDHTADKSADMQTGAAEPPSLTERVSKALWGLLKSELPEDSPIRNAEQPPQLDIDEKKLQDLQQDPGPLADYVVGRIIEVYDLSSKVFRILRSDIQTKVTEILKNVHQTAGDTRMLNLLEKAFSGIYSGDADAKFQQHLVRCCKRYYENPGAYSAPYVTITQSSGFGKSRVLYEVAKKLALSDSVSDAVDMRLLYVCARNVERSSGFPVATPGLSRFFFKDEDIAIRLLMALEYACANWDSVKTEWLGLFGVKSANTDAGESNPKAGVPASSDRKMVGEEQTPKKRQHSLGKTCTVSDDELVAALGKVTLGAAKPGKPTSKKSRSSSGPVPQNQRVQALVFVIDEARSLLEKTDKNGINYFRLLRRALEIVNASLRQEERKAMIFAVLIDTNSQIHDFVPPLSRDSSSRNDKDKITTRLFPPFVLTHTMDVVLNRDRSPEDPAFDYKASVLEGDPVKVWGSLVSMGRPLWHSYVTNATEDSTKGVLFLAGSKLLCGLSPFAKESYESNTLCGVASLLCRLGLRPQSNSAFASQVVADFMAVLHYVTYTHEAHICGYLTEPILAFAATHLWYELSPLPLQNHILPQFRELLVQGVIDVGAIGEVVARIFLLLAMDATIKSTESGNFTLSGGKNRFKGQFCSVKRFLGLLDGSYKPCTEDEASAKAQSERIDDDGPKLLNVTIKHQTVAEGAAGNKKAKPGAMKEAIVDSTKSSSDRGRRGRQAPNRGGRGQQHSSVEETGSTKANITKKGVKFVTEVTDDASPQQKFSFESWMNDWESWSVSFSHFIELTAMPTMTTLWFLLGRRAAAVFPRNQKCADLIIPIFRKSTSEVSFVLIQVKNKSSADSEFPQSALGKLTPATVFQVNEDKHAKHELSEFTPRKMIRIFMSLRESNKNKPAQSYLIDKSVSTDGVNEESYSLCLRGTCRWPKRGSEALVLYWPFLLSPTVSNLLADIAESAWWDPLERINANILRRSREGIAPALELDIPGSELEKTAKITLQLVPYAEAHLEMKAAAPPTKTPGGSRQSE